MSDQATLRGGVDSPADADWRSGLGRFGLTAKGVLYLLLGALALNVAFGTGSTQDVTKTGALQLLARQPMGRWLLLALTAGLFALAAWKAVSAATGDPVKGSDTSDRLEYAAKAVLYLATAVSAAFVVARNWGVSTNGGGGGGGGGGGSNQQAASTLMELPYGVWIVGGVGGAVVIFGLKQLYDHAWRSKFMTRLSRARMQGSVAEAVRRAGRAGYGARGLVIVAIGAFFILAAVQHDPDEARGLSGALGALAQQPWGRWALAAVATGLALYGLFCLAEAYYRRSA